MAKEQGKAKNDDILNEAEDKSVVGADAPLRAEDEDMDFSQLRKEIEDEDGFSDEELSPKASSGVSPVYFFKILGLKFKNMIIKILDFAASVFSMQTSEKARIYFEQGQSYHGKGAYDSAIESFNEVIKVDPGNKEVYPLLGESYARIGRNKDAKKVFQDIVKKDGDNPIPHFWLGRIHLRLGENKEAIESYKKATELAPDVPEFFYRLGVAYDNHGMSQRAISSFSRAISLDSDQGKYYYHMGFSYDSAGDHKKAVECFRKALALEEE